MDGRGNMTVRLSECMCKTARMAEIVRGMHVQCWKSDGRKVDACVG